MALQAVIVSISVEDADGDRASIPIYGVFEDSTVTLSQLLAWASARVSQTDAVTDGRITAMSVQLYPALPTVKGSAVAGSDVERGALFTFALNGLASNKSQSIEVPAFKTAYYVGDGVDNAATDVANWLAGILPPFGTVAVTSEEFYAQLTSLRRSRKSFRKSRT